ncbi:YT521-B-like domain-containing protein, partial [Mycena capillaripes]
YHPNPPAHRSEWVMWVGNVPSDAVHDELWRFLTQPAGGDGGSTEGENSLIEGGGGRERSQNGVLSIFLILRSSCALVNYETEAHLQVALARFNGVPLRANSRCARLLCRKRRKEDELHAGVGGQRGRGMHTRAVKLKQKAGQNVEQDQDFASSASASGSHASTNSSLLRQHFPQRYFILKSLTRDDLDLSVQRGVWATQKHNEGILDRAFRSSKDVFLVFSVNRSGEFYGYARCGWGEDFRLQWLCNDRLPFVRTRYIHNPWNHGREVKVSRDGTEIEPMVGQALLEEWRLYLRSEAGAQTSMPNGGAAASVRSSRAGGGRGAGSRP